MLRNNRSRAFTSKQSLMADHNSQPSSTKDQTKPASTFFGSSRFKAFSTKPLFETDGLISPTSILDTYRTFSVFRSPFTYFEKQPISPKIFAGNKQPFEKSEAKGIAVALNDSMIVKSHDRKLMFSNKLKIEIPQLPQSILSHTQIPKSPSDFGIKTRNSNISANGYENSGIQNKDSPSVYRGLISVSDVANSEDYTCVIYRGPSPRTTHIFDNCIVESYDCCLKLTEKSKSSMDNFLSACYTCRKNLEQKSSVYIYRFVLSN